MEFSSGFCAINAKQLEVKFGAPVDAASIYAAGTGDIVNGVFTLDRIPAAIAPDTDKNVDIDNSTAELSKDGKTLIITAGGTTYFSGKYAFTVTDQVENEDDEAITPYSTVLDVNDTVRPTATTLVYASNKVANINFSEPLASAGTVTFKLADGTSLVTNPVASLDTDGSIKINLTGINVADQNKDIVVTVVGAADAAGNLVSPNPLTKTVKYSTADTTAPTVAAVTVTTNTQFSVKFSEELDATTPTITVGGAPVASANIVKDSTDPTKYNVTLATAATGLQTVSVSAFTDKNGNPQGTTYSKVVNFDVDTTAPVVASSKVEKVNGVEYLVVTFNENVKPVDAKTVNLTYVKDFVSKTASILTDANGAAPTDNFTLYSPVSGKSTSVKLALSTLTDAATYTATLPKGLVTDLNGLDNEETQVTFTRGGDASVTKPAVDTTQFANGIEAVDSNTVNVYFTAKVDGATATNKANYAIEGAVISKAELVSNDAVGGYKVKLTLAADSSTFDGLRTVTVSGVKSETGDATMDAYTTSESLLENVRPTITKAELTAVNSTPAPGTTEITLTFSEALDDTTVVADAGADFDVFVGGVKYAGTVTEGGTGNAYTLQLDSALTPAQLTSGIVIKPATGMDATDANGNKVNLTQVTVAQ